MPSAPAEGPGRRSLDRYQRVRHWLPWINRISGVLLLHLGVLMLSGSFTLLTSLMASWSPEWLSSRL